jgi:hypothetical protein
MTSEDNAAACVQIATARGFMTMASSTLRMLLDLVKHMPICSLFASGSLSTHSAHISLYLLTQMLGERSQSITQCTDVDWKPDTVLVNIVSLVLALARDPSFVKVRHCKPGHCKDATGPAFFVAWWEHVSHACTSTSGWMCIRVK